MLVITIAVLLIGLVSSQTYTADSCGLRPLARSGPEDYARIVGGEESIRGDWPWSCSMRYNGAHRCGGSLINDQWIITAAHCVTGVVPNIALYTWACGLHDRTSSDSWTEIYTTAEIVKHEFYSGALIQNDIALFRLNEQVVYNDYILPACFPAVADAYPGDWSIATGWGSTVSGGGSAPRQREVSMIVLTDARCEQRFDGSNNMLNPATQICAGEEGEGKDTCQGDSGGPLVVQHDDDSLWYLVGLTSWGYGCGDGGVYTRTSGFRGWVEALTGPLPTGRSA